jgi:hypothetical protein
MDENTNTTAASEVVETTFSNGSQVEPTEQVESTEAIE